MKQSKKALSNIVAMIFLILVSLLAVTVFWIVIKDLIADQTEQIEQRGLNCITDVSIEIISACSENNLLKITIKNKRELTLGDFFLIDYTYLDGTSEAIPTPPFTFLEAYETKTLVVEYPKPTERIKVIPKIESQIFLCYDNAPEFSNINECEENE